MSHHFHGADERVNAVIYQDLFGWHVVPWIQWMYLDGNYIFQQDSGAGSHRLNHPAVLEGNHSGILDPSGLAAIFPGPESAGLFYLEHLTEEVPGYAPHQFGSPMLVHHQVVEPDVMAYVRRTCRSFHSRLEAVVAKNGNYIE
jgi:hypothetical protein